MDKTKILVNQFGITLSTLGRALSSGGYLFLSYPELSWRFHEHSLIRYFSLDELDELDLGIEMNVEPEINIDEDFDEVIYGKKYLTSFFF